VTLAPHILVVDDHREIRDALAKYLEKNGMRVTVAANAAAMDVALKAGAFDLIVLDVMMPGEDGLSVCRRLRANGSIPILMLTALGDETDRIVGLELGADDYLPKPFNPRELLARLKAVLRRHAMPSADRQRVLRFGRLEIDPSSRKVRIDDRDCAMTGYQFDILVALAENAGRILSRDQ
jgi:two-component system OmpR family response regulator